MGLILTADYKKVLEGFVVTRGKLEASQGTIITIKMPTVEMFQFSDGECALTMWVQRTWCTVFSPQWRAGHRGRC